MTTLPQAAEAIRQALEKATPGPWEYSEFCDHDGPSACDDLQVCADVGPHIGPLLTIEWSEKPYDSLTREVGEANGRFISAANPAALRLILDALEEKDRDIAQLNRLHEVGLIQIDAAVERYEAAEAKLAQARELLAVIARGPNHPGYISGIPSSHYAGFGQEAIEMARAFLAQPPQGEKSNGG